MCFDGVCGYQCKKDGVIGDPGYDQGICVYTQ
jgi:hypothetical protein